MSIRDIVEECINIQDPGAKASKLDNITYWLTEASYRNRAPQTEEIGEAAAFLMKFAFAEKHEVVKREMLNLLRVFSWYGIDSSIDWDGIVAQLPLLPEEMLCTVLEILGQSIEHNFVDLLEEYFNHSSLWVQLTALEAMTEIYWRMSDQSDEMRKILELDEIQHLSFLILNPSMHDVPDTKIREQIIQVHKALKENIRSSFENDD